MQSVIEFVTQAHAGQVRKSGELPYVIHCFDVLHQLYNWGIHDKVIWKSALCHDVLEDRLDISYDTLAELIGKEAADIVCELSFFPIQDSEKPRKVQKAEYISSFYKKSPKSIVVKVSDRICNTLDYLSSDEPKDTCKYWHKADDLFNAVFIRRREIKDIIGKDSYDIMYMSIQDVEDKLGVNGKN